MKPGWKTSQFWLQAVSVVVGCLVASGIFSAASPVMQGLGLLQATLSALGYQWLRNDFQARASAAKPDESVSIRTRIQ